MDKPHITYSLPLDAKPEVVESVIAAIRRSFGLASSDLIPAASLTVKPGESAPFEGGEPQTTAAEALADLDADGLPYDARIHSGSKKKNADGRWQRRKNTPQELVDSVTAELKARQSGSAPAPAAPAPVAPPAPPAPPAPGVEPPPLPAVSPYQKLLQETSAGIARGDFNNEWLDQIATHCGVVGGIVNLAAATPEKVKEVRDTIQLSLGGIGKSL